MSLVNMLGLSAYVLGVVVFISFFVSIPFITKKIIKGA